MGHVLVGRLGYGGCRLGGLECRMGIGCDVLCKELILHMRSSCVTQSLGCVVWWGRQFYR